MRERHIPRGIPIAAQKNKHGDVPITTQDYDYDITANGLIHNLSTKYSQKFICK